MSAETVNHHNPIYVPDGREVTIESVNERREPPAGREATLIAPDGAVSAIPAAEYAVVRRVLEELARGHAVQLIAYPKELTTQQAADILNISRTYLIRLLHQGQMPFVRVGTHRRIKLEDVLAYRAQRSEQRRESLAAMAQTSQDLGVY